MVDASWSLAPLGIAAVIAGTVGYLVAWNAAAERDGVEPSRVRVYCMLGAAVVALVALVSPLARLGEQMVGFHMVQHVLLLDFAPILVVLAVTPAVARPVLPRIRRVERRLPLVFHPVTIVVLYAGGLWLWHTRPLYEFAVSSGGTHALQHAWFFVTGLLFWWYALGAIRPRHRPRGMGVFMFVTATKLITGGLATAILGTSLAEYPSYADQPRLDGMDAAEDRGFAGGLLLFEELIVMSVALGVMFMRMLGESDDEERAKEARLTADA